MLYLIEDKLHGRRGHRLDAPLASLAAEGRAVLVSSHLMSELQDDDRSDRRRPAGCPAVE